MVTILEMAVTLKPLTLDACSFSCSIHFKNALKVAILENVCNFWTINATYMYMILVLIESSDNFEQLSFCAFSPYLW